MVPGAVDRDADGGISCRFVARAGPLRGRFWADDHEQVRNGFRVIEDDGTLEERGVRGWIEGPWQRARCD
jgi:hypothetical protein